MKILAAGDLHGDSKLAKKLAEKAKKAKVDLVILTGDIVSPIETKNFLKPFKEKNEKVLLLPGNWESVATIDFLAELYGMKNIHGYSAKYKDVGIFGAGEVAWTETGESQILKNTKKNANNESRSHSICYYSNSGNNVFEQPLFDLVRPSTSEMSENCVLKLTLVTGHITGLYK